MTKFCSLAVLLLCLATHWASAQDDASFTITRLGNGTIQFNNTSTVPDTHRRRAVWIFGDNQRATSAPLAGITHTYAAPGNYRACLIIYRYGDNYHDSVGTADACETIVIEGNTPTPSCAAVIEVGEADDPRVKSLHAVWEHSGERKPERICWTFGDGTDTCINYGPDAENYSVRHRYPGAGRYNTCVRIQFAGGCVAEKCRTVEIGESDSCSLHMEWEAGDNPLTRHFFAGPRHSGDKRPLRICWTFGDGRETCLTYGTDFSGPYRVAHTYDHYGEYEVCARALFDGGCETGRTCRVVEVAEPNEPSAECTAKVYEVANSGTGTERQFFVTPSTNQRPERICWHFGDGTDTCINLPAPLTPQSLTISHRFPAPGAYRVVAAIWFSGGCVAETFTETVIRVSGGICGAYFTDSLLAPGAYLFRGYGVLPPTDRVTTYRWTFGDGASADGPVADHHFAPGTYEVCLLTQSVEGCTTKLCRTLEVTGTQEPPLRLSPNPVVGNLHVVFHSALAETVTLSIYNVNGTLVKSFTRGAAAGTNAWDLDLSTLPAGIYSLVVHSPSQLANAIFFKQ